MVYYVNYCILEKTLKMAKATAFVRKLTDMGKQKLTLIKRRRSVDYSPRQRAFFYNGTNDIELRTATIA